MAMSSRPCAPILEAVGLGKGITTTDTLRELSFQKFRGSEAGFTVAQPCSRSTASDIMKTETRKSIYPPERRQFIDRIATTTYRTQQAGENRIAGSGEVSGREMSKTEEFRFTACSLQELHHP
jgi:hypothetical protein